MSVHAYIYKMYVCDTMRSELQLMNEKYLKKATLVFTVKFLKVTEFRVLCFYFIVSGSR